METPSPVPSDEASILAALADPGRVAAVRDTGLLDTPPEESFDRLTRLAAKLTGAPVTFVSLVDSSRDFYKSAFGLGEPLNTTRQLEGRSFCHYDMVSDGPLVLADVTQMAVFCDVPTVKSLGVRAYAGIPLVTAHGQVLGSFCAVDFKPRQWTETDVEVLVELAHSALREIQLRRAVRESDALNRRLLEQLQRVDELNRALAELATTDSLTGLRNRRAFDHSLALELAIVERHRSPLSLLMLDVDHFKRINDRLGHDAEDQVLQMIGQVLSAGARVIDIVARVGGRVRRAAAEHGRAGRLRGGRAHAPCSGPDARGPRRRDHQHRRSHPAGRGSRLQPVCPRRCGTVFGQRGGPKQGGPGLNHVRIPQVSL